MPAENDLKKFNLEESQFWDLGLTIAGWRNEVFGEANVWELFTADPKIDFKGDLVNKNEKHQSLKSISKCFPTFLFASEMVTNFANLAHTDSGYYSDDLKVNLYVFVAH